MVDEGKIEAPLIKELGDFANLKMTPQKKSSPPIYSGLLPLLLLIVAMLFAGLANGIAKAATDSPEVRVGSELEFPPYAFVDKSGQPVGFSVDLIKAVADAMGLSIKISTGPWDTIWSDLVAGRLDVLPIVAKSPERQRLVDFSLPHTETYDAFFVRQGNPRIQNIEAARGKEIVVMRSDAAHHALLERNFPGRLILVETIPAGLSLISSGKHDAFLCSKLISTMVIKQHGLKDLNAGPPIPDYKRVFSFAVKKGDVELLEKLNQGLLIIKTNREYDRIYEKWLSADDPWRMLKKYLWPAIVIVIAIVLITGFWLVMLQLLVKKRTRQLSESNEMLHLAQEGLEEKVTQRTVELANANVALQSEIAERKLAEEELQESEARFRSLFENMTEGVALHEMLYDDQGRAVDYRIVSTNPGFEKHTGLKPEQIQGQLASIAYGTDAAPYLEEYARVAQTGQAYAFETLFPPMQRHFHISVTSPKQGQFVTVFEDITDRKRAEDETQRLLNAIQQEKDKLTALVTSINDEVWFADPQKKFALANPSALREFGLSSEEEIDVEKLSESLEVHRSDGSLRPIEEAPPLRALQGELITNLEEIIRNPISGKLRYRQVSAAPVRDVNGNIIGSVSVVRDITELKRAEEALRESEEHYHSLFDHMLEGFAYCQMHFEQNQPVDFTFLNINGAFETLTGLKNVVGKKVSEVIPGIQESAPELFETYGRVALTGISERLETYVEPLKMWFSISVYSSKKEHFVAVFDVITERKQAEEALCRLNAELEQRVEERTEELKSTVVHLGEEVTERQQAEAEIKKLNEELEKRVKERTAELEMANEEMGSFSYSVSHDLKTPIRAIQGFSRMLMEEHADKLDAEGLRLLKVVSDNTRLMDHLIDDLLALSRLGRQHVRKSVIDLAAMTRQVFEKLRAQEPKRDLRLTLGDLPPCLCDHSLFYQVMENLLANAIKFTKSRKTASIEVGGRTEGLENIYYVKDNGVGFDENYAHNLFRPFQRLHRREDYEGTGIGLAIIKRIVQKHDGRVWAEGKLNEGATFYFALPKNED